MTTFLSCVNSQCMVKEKSSKDDRLKGRVFRAEAGFYRVKTEKGFFLCTLRGRLKKKNLALVDPVAVGDNVIILPGTDGQGVVEEVFPRRTKLSRCDSLHGHKEQIIAANVDQVIAVQSCTAPGLNLRALDRYLAVAENGGMDGVICLNKIDLDDKGELRCKLEMYRNIGYKLLFTSAITGEGVSELKEILSERLSVVTGPSGAGKSTLLNAVQPGFLLKTGIVSDSTSKGKHTTTWVEMLSLDCGGFVVDTPGLREIGLWNVEKADLAYLFPEMEEYPDYCKYPNCLHNTEPKCAVKKAVESGEISQERYTSYLNILDSI